MAEEQEQPQPQRQTLSMPQVNPYLVAQDDYTYESKPLPKKAFQPEGQQTQQGGMSNQFEIVTSQLNKNL